ncbi:MAG: hypothetical protein C0522_04715 [Rhodocyclaceae bacterium]|jgi:Kef-type K+ transport system membrane component KefB|nr:hypothetical protein [Rhodocyclaceae bacterium]
MPDLSFFPAFPLPYSALVVFGLLLIAGYAAGELFFRMLRLPRITGYLLAGIALGENGFALLKGDLFRMADLFLNIALGMIIFQLGQRFSLRWLRRNRWIVATSLLESGCAFAAVYFALTWLGIAEPPALIAAAIAMSSSPLIAPVVARDLHAEGQVTERALCLVVLNSVLAFLAVAFMLSFLHSDGVIEKIYFRPLYILLGSVLVGLGLGFVAAFLGWLLMPREGGSVILLVSLTVIGIGAVDSLRLSALITLLVFGVMTKNYARGFRLATFDTGTFGRLLVVVLFVVSGALLPLQWQPQWAIAVLAFVVARLAAKTVAVTALAHPSGMSLKKGGLLGMMLVPLSITEFTLVRETAQSHPEIGADLGSIVFPAIVLMELIGPVITQWALRWAHEAYEPVREAA